MSNVTHSNANLRLSYTLDGAHVANLRCSELDLTYGVNSIESHARRYRAFYPHLRVQGTFATTVDCMQYGEYQQAMNWFQDYFTALINARSPSAMLVQMDSRDFVRLGIPTSGINFGDHTASMVFSPTISFISVADPRDPSANIQKLSAQVSRAKLLADNDITTQWFYPESRYNNPGNLQAFLYDQAEQDAALAAAQIQDALNPPTPPPTPGAPVRGGGTGIQ